MKNTIFRCAGVGFWIWGTLLAAACGRPDPGLALELHVLEQDLSLRGSPAEPGVAPAGIDSFRLCLQKTDGSAETCQDYTDLSADAYRIGGLPVGKHWVVSFQGYRVEDREAVWCGRAREVEIADAKTTTVRMLLTRCGDFTQTVQQPTIPRMLHTATARADGRVLLAGGFTSHSAEDACDPPCESLWATDSVEIYSHADGSFGEASGVLAHARGGHAALGLPDGRLLVAGGCEQASMQPRFADNERPGSPLGCPLPGMAATTAEIFDPATGSSQVFDIPATVFAAAAPVGENELLLIGGQDEAGVPLSRVTHLTVEGDQLQVVTIEQALVEARRSPTAVVFSRPGEELTEILVVGGNGAIDRAEPGNFAERIAFQSGGLFSQIPRAVEEMYNEGLPVMHASGARAGPGEVVVAGGVYPSAFKSDDDPFLPTPVTATARFDMRTDSVRMLDGTSQLLEPRAFHTSTTVDIAGHVLVIGGMSIRRAGRPMGYEAIDSVEWWDGEAGYFSLRWVGGVPAEMEVARAGHTATLLEDGTVLVVGGTDGVSIHTSAELFNPAPTSLGSEGLPAL